MARRTRKANPAETPAPKEPTYVISGCTVTATPVSPEHANAVAELAKAAGSVGAAIEAAAKALDTSRTGPITGIRVGPTYPGDYE